MRSYAPLKLRELRNHAGRRTGLFAVSCFPKYSTQRDDFDEWHGVVLCRDLLANKNAIKYSCIYCKTLLYLQHDLNTFVIIL